MIISAVLTQRLHGDNFDLFFWIQSSVPVDEDDEEERAYVLTTSWHLLGDFFHLRAESIIHQTSTSPTVLAPTLGPARLTVYLLYLLHVTVTSRSADICNYREHLRLLYRVEQTSSPSPAEDWSTEPRERGEIIPWNNIPCWNIHLWRLWNYIYTNANYSTAGMCAGFTEKSPGGSNELRH